MGRPLERPCGDDLADVRFQVTETCLRMFATSAVVIDGARRAEWQVFAQADVPSTASERRELVGFGI